MGGPRTDDELRWWLALNRAAGANSRCFTRWLVRWGGPRPAVEALEAGRVPRRVSAGAPNHVRSTDWRGVEQDLAWAGRSGHTIVCLGQAAYPPLLAAIADPPPVLFVSGDPGALGATQVAVVGARSATTLGRSVARRLGREFAGVGLALTSGLARGIDAAAHDGACAAGGASVGVAAHGLDRTYPRAHRALFERVAGAGAVVSEFPIGTPPRRAHFPQRNRLVSGLGLGVVVVEAAARSGSLITARLAAEQGREVFAVPGAVASPMAAGCHRLLRDGAGLVETVEDVLAGLPQWAAQALRGPGRPGLQAAAPAASQGAAGAGPTLSRQSREVLESLDFTALSMEEVANRTGLTIEIVSSILLALEIQGLVSSEPGSRYARTPEAHCERDRLGRVDVPVRPLPG